MPEPEFKLEISDHENMESQIIEKFQKNNPSKFNSIISSLISSLSAEKNEDETKLTFEDRLISETEKILVI